MDPVLALVTVFAAALLALVAICRLSLRVPGPERSPGERYREDPEFRRDIDRMVEQARATVRRRLESDGRYPGA